MRGRLAIRLLWALIAVVVGTYAYIWISELNPNELNTVVACPRYLYQAL
jgi:hypothetical protein